MARYVSSLLEEGAGGVLRISLLMNFLVEAMSAHLNGQLGLVELVSAVQKARIEMGTHQDDISAMVSGVPDFLVSLERDQWLAVFTELNRRLAEVEANVRDRTKIEALHQELPGMLEDLSLKAFSLRECAWAARGPSSHSGVNELLYLLDQYLAEPGEALFHLLQAKLDVEFTRLENQAEIFRELPEFAALAMEELLPEYQALLETVAAIEELADEDLDGLFARLEEWGLNYSAYDIDFFTKRYSYAPTPIPCINLALNSQLLFLDGIIGDDMLEFVLESAMETLQSGSEKFLENPSLSEVERHSFKELLEKMLSGIEALPDYEDREVLKGKGGELVENTRKFVEIQTRSETESGSRLDYKSE